MRILFFILLLSSRCFAQSGNTLVIGNYAHLCFSDTTIIYSDSLPESIDSVRLILFFSGSTSKLAPEDLERLTTFLEGGGGLYLGADNQPLQSETNQITNKLYKKECYGEFNEPVAVSNSVDGRLHLSDLEEIPAGTTTVAFPLDYRLHVEAWISDEPLILSGEWGMGRLIIDGGYSRFYCSCLNEDSEALFQKFISYLRFQ